jgi:hypothetical protein
LLSEDSSWESDTARWYELFSLPGVFHASENPSVQSFEVHYPEEENYIVRWAIIKPFDLSAERLFQAIGNQDHGLTPSVRGRVHIFDPSSETLLHMYDDRGMDIIAASLPPLEALKQTFPSWIIREKLDGANREFRASERRDFR